jgi:hypothetical protein
MLIGTDVADMNKTKNFLISEVASLFSGDRGLFYSTVDQALPLPNTAYPILIENTGTDETTGISVVTNGSGLSRITFSTAGVYQIGFSAQLKNSGGSKHSALFWLAKNGELFADVINNTTKRFTLEGGTSFAAPHCEYMVKVDANDFINLMWAGDSANLSIEAEAAGSYYPNIPSAMVIVNKV